MKLRTSLLTILLFLACLAVQAQQTIPFELAQSGHIMLKAQVNGVEGNFILDTGGGLTVITESFASKLNGLVKQDGGYTGFRATGERIDADLYTAREVTIGDHPSKETSLAIVDADFGPIDGLISLMSFRDQPFTIDFADKIVYLENTRSLAKRKKNGQVVPLQLEASRGVALDMFAYFVVNDKLTLQFLLDSGAGAGVFRLNSRYATALGVDIADTTKVEKTYRRSEINADVQTVIYRTAMDKLAVKGQPAIKIENFKAQLVEGLIYDGIMSVNWLGKQITINLAQREMIVGNKPARGSGTQTGL
ncbi:retropepsin-like aspartic protease [Pontibacter silvestris]|uniref:Retropepsin-like aspartic protease n=1 Tax=Pontibacter silvestris TaxID=2305183 RepID=A0ABW4WZ34_9BACT|nr:retropepsin-like aspartic protease [Pontibacter silvestris]MCC9136780.1 retroviral-like aspartic protease family protein [Pontibacter silvestris]